MKLRAKASIGPGFQFRIPPKFWRGVEDVDAICANDSCLTPEQKERLCRLLDIQNPPPGKVRVDVWWPDLERCLRETDKRLFGKVKR